MTIVVSAKDFGPIAEGSVEVKPFTVLVGPNNSGKSFLSTLLYCAASYPSISAGGSKLFPRGGFYSVDFVGSRRENELEEMLAEELNKQVETSRGTPARVKLGATQGQRRVLREIMHYYLEKYAESVVLDLERCLGGHLSDFIRYRNRAARQQMEISIQGKGVGWHVRIVHEKGEESAIRVTRIPGVNKLVKDINRVLLSGPGTSITADLFRRNDNKVYEDAVTILASLVMRTTHNFLFDDIPPNRHYLPAARSGIMQSHKTVAAVLVGNAAWVGTRRMDLPQMSGLVTDFIVQLLSLSPERRSIPRRSELFGGQEEKWASLRNAASNLEQNILHGQIVMQSKDNSYPEILYRVGDFLTPLGRISSMVSELAPVVLYLRHVLQPNDYMLIEEPEAHLHPQSQRQFAHVLAELSNAVDVTLTTHSDYFLTEINNLIRRATLFGPESAEQPHYLSHQNVAAYLFKPNEAKGTQVEKLEISSVDGIPDEEFGKVAEAIYNEAAELQHKILESEQ